MNDPVNHPAHYMTNSGIETIEVIEAFTEGLTGAEAVLTGNVLKYMCRWKRKGGLTDLEKAQWYLNRLIDFVKDNQLEDAELTPEEIDRLWKTGATKKERMTAFDA